MKLKNKKTGEITEFKSVDLDKGYGVKLSAESLAELNEEWCDAPEEPEWYWYINCFGKVLNTLYNGNEWDEQRKLIGNYFETKEEAEKAVEKLKAWKRLEDKGFRFTGWDENHHNLGIIEFSFDKVKNNVWDFEKDLALLFCTEENS